LKNDGFQTEVMQKLNSLGAAGWELISAEGLNESSIFWKASDTVEILFLLKRKILEQ
jgi:hypothetical protein